MIVVECYRDEALLHRIGFTPEQIKHEFGSSRVLGRVEQERELVIGIIDEDPRVGKHPAMKEYKLQRSAKKAIKLLKRRNDETKRLIQISPRLEDWLCEVAKRNKISPKKYGLPDDPEELHREVSLAEDENSQRENFRRFLIALVRANDDEIDTLRKWLREAIE